MGIYRRTASRMEWPGSITYNFTPHLQSRLCISDSYTKEHSTTRFIWKRCHWYITDWVWENSCLCLAYPQLYPLKWPSLQNTQTVAEGVDISTYPRARPSSISAHQCVLTAKIGRTDQSSRSTSYQHCNHCGRDVISKTT